MAINGTNPNRQRMINLMYIVFIAMMALNVSSDVLDGFTKVNKSLDETLVSNNNQNKELKNIIKTQYNINPEKAYQWYKRSLDIENKTKELNNYIEGLKIRIVKETDGKNADVKNIDRKDYIEATNTIMLSPVNPEANNLKQKLEEYKRNSLLLIDESPDSEIFKDLLNTSNIGLQSWTKATFNNMPTAATITLLTKLQNDVSIIEYRVLSTLLKKIDAGDYKVNRLNAEVIPSSKIVMLGQQYIADIILSSIDTTQRPSIYVSGKRIPQEANGRYSIVTNKVGTFPIEGYLEVQNETGDIIKRNFKSEYTVVEPIATIAPKLMNIVYLGIDNPINIAMPGFSSDKIYVSIDNGNITKKGNEWIVRPNTISKDAIISVSAKTDDGRTISLGSTSLKVRSLPDPSPYISVVYEGNTVKRFKNGRIQKNQLLEAKKLSAAIDDNILDINFDVQSFSITSFDSMGNAIPEVSNSNQFSDRQIRQIKNLRRGSRLYITDIKAKGPDGSIRNISPMEIILM